VAVATDGLADGCSSELLLCYGVEPLQGAGVIGPVFYLHLLSAGDADDLIVRALQALKVVAKLKPLERFPLLAQQWAPSLDLGTEGSDMLDVLFVIHIIVSVLRAAGLALLELKRAELAPFSPCYRLADEFAGAFRAMERASHFFSLENKRGQLLLSEVIDAVLAEDLLTARATRDWSPS